MAVLIISVEIPDVDTALVDPWDSASQITDEYNDSQRANGGPEVVFLEAVWEWKASVKR